MDVGVDLVELLFGLLLPFAVVFLFLLDELILLDGLYFFEHELEFLVEGLVSKEGGVLEERVFCGGRGESGDCLLELVVFPGDLVEHDLFFDE